MRLNNAKYLLPYFSVRNSVKASKGTWFFNLLAFLIIISCLIIVSLGTEEMIGPISELHSEQISLDPINLIGYSLQTVLRMLIAVIFSLVFALIYATLAAKNPRLEKILIPLLDVLQSIPILGYISFTVAGFLLLFPGSTIGPQAAAIFAIFTSQAWNITFSFYQSLKSIPEDLTEASQLFKMSTWQKFWRVEVPYGLPGLIWNIVISMSGGWFFVVASEVITVGKDKITLPGIGSYIALALEQRDVPAIFYAITAMVVVISLYDQLLLRSLVAWSYKFRYETCSSNKEPPQSFVLNIFRRSTVIQFLFKPVSYLARFILYLPLLNSPATNNIAQTDSPANTLLDYLWNIFLLLIFIACCYYFFNFLYLKITIAELYHVFCLSCITLLRVMLLIALASIIWVPIGIYIGLRPNLVKIAQPLAQFLAAFPANLLFPVMVLLITRYNLNPEIWLSPLMILGTQWYILFNVIAGSAAFPNDLNEVATNLNLKGWLWYRKIILPAIAPHFITGAITACGGAWNASIIAEIVTYGNNTIVATGIGSYIAKATIAANFPQILLGITMMALFVVLLNRLFWQPIHDYIDIRCRL